MIVYYLACELIPYCMLRVVFLTLFVYIPPHLPSGCDCLLCGKAQS